ncbi:NAD(P)H-dependent flavin oxidoreductase [Pararhodobacter marinus]|uniref:NAD(P)H-dependent flavin oxidoreductase n=1 Tax=Pararhodobacter marinus TaxID=2184063 RepID=UPI003510F787
MSQRPSSALFRNLRVPVVGAPMFLVSGPDLVIAQGRAGILGTFPSLNARTTGEFAEWCDRVSQSLPVSAPWGVNLIAAPTNARLGADLEICIAKKVPLVITSFHAPPEIAQKVIGYGGVHLHDVATLRHAKKALASGCSGLILVCAGAGGHGGTLSPMAFADEVRRVHDGLMLIGGGISTGAGVLSARAAGADAAYVGTRFIAAEESLASQDYRQMLIEAGSADITYTPLFSGVAANYLSQSIVRSGLDLASMPHGPKRAADQSKPEGVRTWVDVLGAGHGAGAVERTETTETIVATLQAEYRAALDRLAA